MQKIAYSGEDLALIVKAATGSSVAFSHKKPDKTMVATNPTMTEDASTGDFYHTFNSTDLGVHKLTIVSDDTDINGSILTLELREKSIEDISTEVASVQSDVDGLETSVSSIATDVDGLETSVSSLDTKIDNVKTVVDSISSSHAGSGWI